MEEKETMWRDRLSCVGRAGVETGPGVEYPGTVGRQEAGNISEEKTTQFYHAEVDALYLPCTVWKSVEQILILDIQDLNINMVSYLLENFKTSTFIVGF